MFLQLSSVYYRGIDVTLVPLNETLTDLLHGYLCSSTSTEQRIAGLSNTNIDQEHFGHKVDALAMLPSKFGIIKAENLYNSSPSHYITTL